jgi:hypothetical protein
MKAPIGLRTPILFARFQAVWLTIASIQDESPNNVSLQKKGKGG